MWRAIKPGIWHLRGGGGEGGVGERFGVEESGEEERRVRRRGWRVERGRGEMRVEREGERSERNPESGM